LTFLAIQRPGISRYCGVCGKEYLSEEINQLERVSTLDESGESALDGTPNTKGLAQALLEAAMGAEREDRALIPTGGKRVPDTPIAREPIGIMETQSSLASLLFAACDVCVYCGGKFRTDGTV
jgi:Putative zinc-finger of transcription factor IIIC complex